MLDRHKIACRASRLEPLHGDEHYCSARAFAVNSCAFGAPFGLREIDSSARPSKGGLSRHECRDAASIRAHQIDTFVWQYLTNKS